MSNSKSLFNDLFWVHIAVVCSGIPELDLDFHRSLMTTSRTLNLEVKKQLHQYKVNGTFHNLMCTHESSVMGLIDCPTFNGYYRYLQVGFTQCIYNSIEFGER